MAAVGLTIGSLFSGIGGLDLGLEWAGLGPTVWQVERDPFCRSVLTRHWPEVRRYDEIEAVDPAELVRPGIICGGFPCQDISPAGTGAGLAGRRSGLWSQFARIVSAARPPWVVVENSGGAGSRWVDQVAGDLEQQGYEALPCPVSAWGCGASHWRPRVFIVAHLDGEQLRDKRQREPGRRSERVQAQGQAEPADHGPAGAPRGGANPDPGGVRADAAGQRCRAGLPAPGSGTARDQGARAADGGAFQWGFEPDLVRAVHGIPHRVDRVRALGNAVVPQCAEVIGWAIRDLAGL